MLPLAWGEVPTRSSASTWPFVEVDEDLVAVNLDVDVDVDGLGVDAVVVDVVDEAPLALGQRGDLGAGEGLGGVEDVGHVALHLLEAILVDEAEEVALPEADGGEEGSVLDADVLLEDAPDGLVELAFLVEFEHTSSSEYSGFSRITLRIGDSSFEPTLFRISASASRRPESMGL